MNISLQLTWHPMITNICLTMSTCLYDRISAIEFTLLLDKTTTHYTNLHVPKTTTKCTNHSIISTKIWLGNIPQFPLKITRTFKNAYEATKSTESTLLHWSITTSSLYYRSIDGNIKQQRLLGILKPRKMKLWRSKTRLLAEPALSS